VLRALRAEEATKKIRVLILSNSSREQDLEAIKELGVTDYLVKANLSLQGLGDRVAQLLEGDVHG
jgi:CheY-like chemotaxis protein